MPEENSEYITLFEAAKCCPYSEPYLRLRARQGKLKSLKLGKKWMTTKAWVSDYTERARAWNEKIAAKKVLKASIDLAAVPRPPVAVFASQEPEADAEPVQLPAVPAEPMPPAVPDESAAGDGAPAEAPADDEPARIDPPKDQRDREMPHFDFVLASGAMFAILIFAGIALSRGSVHDSGNVVKQSLPAGTVLKGQITDSLLAGDRKNAVSACVCYDQSDAPQTPAKYSPAAPASSDFLERAVLGAVRAINSVKFPWGD